MKVMYCGTAQWLAGVTILWIGSASDERCSFSFIKADLIVCSAFAAAADLHSCIDHQNAPMAGHQRVRSGSVGSLFKFRDPLRVHQRLTLCTRLTAVSSVSALCISLHCHVQAANSSIVKCSLFLFEGAEQPRLLRVSRTERSHVWRLHFCLLLPSCTRRIMNNLKCWWCSLWVS